MPVHQTGFSGEAIVPCSHCNANDKGPEAGICHRNSPDACIRCLTAANGGKSLGILMRVAASATGVSQGIQCSYCDGKGYRRV
jgi:hypothetical protein